MSEFLIFSSIPVLMIICGVGERNDYECWSVRVLECWSVGILEAHEFGESRRTSSCDRYISTWDDMSEIILGDPVEELDRVLESWSLGVFDYCFKILPHIRIELTEDEDNLMIMENSFQILEYLFKYCSSSLTPTDDKEVFFISFPFDRMLECLILGILVKKYSCKYLSDHFAFSWIEVFFCRVKTEKDSCCNLPKDSI